MKVALFAAPLQGSQSSENARVALVIGNSAYEHVSALKNPVNDAADIGATLENLGFTVNRVLDASKGEIERAVDTFHTAASRGGTEVALFYYSGHGVEHEGINYIIPVTADIGNEYQLMDQAVSLNRVVNAMERGQAEFNMVVLDACRDNPFFHTRSAGNRGLAAMSGGGKGSMIVFATSPGDVAQDGGGRNSPFTQAFMEHVATPGLEVSTLIRRINGTVRELTSGNQTPWFNASYTGEVFLSAAEDLANAGAKTAAIYQEVAALEAEIARRQAEIEVAQSREEKARLEADQRRARAEEEAKRLQAQQLAEIEEQARRVLEQREAEDAMRAQMEEQLAAQRISLTRQAEERRTQLEQLSRQNVADTDIWDRFETIAGINRAVSDVNARFGETIERMEREVNALYDEREAAIRKNNPKEPWDTKQEYEDLIASLAAEVNAERRADIERRRGELEQSRRGELAKLHEQLSMRKAELNGSEFTLGVASTAVSVARFNAEEKRFLIEVRASVEQFSFTVPMSYTIDSRDRNVLRDEYYRVFSADQSSGLAGEINYTVFELYPDLWVLQPVRARVVNLIENDAELARSGGTIESGGEMLVSTAGEVTPIAAVVRFESGDDGPVEVFMDGTRVGTTDLIFTVPEGGELGTIRTEYRWPDGRRRGHALNVKPGINPAAVVSPYGVGRRGMVLFSGLVPETEVQVGSVRQLIDDRSSLSVLTMPDGRYPYSISGRWLSEKSTGSVTVSSVQNPLVRIGPRETGLSVVGEVVVSADTSVRSEAHVFTTGNEPVTTVSLSAARTKIKLPPGNYTIALRRLDDSYYARVEAVTVAAQRATEVAIGELPYSVRYELENAQARHAQVERKISRLDTRRLFGWAFLGAGILGLGGAGFSYVQGEAAVDDYNSATTTAEVSAAREDAAQWGLYLNIGAIVGVVSSVLGSGMLTFGPGHDDLIDQRNELDQQIKSLGAEYARQQAENVLYGSEM